MKRRRRVKLKLKVKSREFQWYEVVWEFATVEWARESQRELERKV